MFNIYKTHLDPLTPTSYESHLIPPAYTYLKNINPVRFINPVMITYNEVKK